MKTQEVANRLVELCKQGQWDQAHSELYADNVVSLEPAGAPAERIEGIEGVRQKGKQWAEMTEEVHGLEIGEPVVAENYFSMRMMIDSTMKGMGRSKMEEICMYQVQDGKIVQEQFFYTPQPPQQN